LTRLRGLRLYHPSSYNWALPSKVRIELTRLRGLRRKLFQISYRLPTSKNWIDPFEGIETFYLHYFFKKKE